MMADALIKYETVDSAQIDSIMEGIEPGPPADWGDDDKPRGKQVGPDEVQQKDEGQSVEGPAIDGPARPA